ncbi:peptidylprolyl isomerase [Poseidonibacter sp.]|uniref:peptidylprolyl isomerase n=2 Tax=Poseidonibacter sp. TaxID=2321188 RepID=UPI003C77FD72
MITWMQRHKRWLVITIWISTIAFVGAGFVGWGSYEYGKQGGVVAVVGDREISNDEYQEEYSRLYEQYANAFGSAFNKDMAEKLNLKNIAYTQVLQKNLILSYGESLGIDVTNKDIAKELVKYNAFLKDGKFDKDTYVQVLSQNRTTPVKFEDSLKRNILLQKIQTLFEVDANQVEVQNLNKLLFVQDDISIKILNSNDIVINPSENELKKYWEENKNSYMSEISYELKTSEVELLSANASEEDISRHYAKFKGDYKKPDGKLKSLEEAKAEIIKELDVKFTKKTALKKYLQIKKEKENLVNDVVFAQSELPYTNESNEKIITAKVGDLLKPVFENDKFIIAKVIKINKSQPLPYKDALTQVTVDYTKVTKEKQLNELARRELTNFNGTKISNVTRESIDKIEGLSEQEAAKFLNELFSSTVKSGIVNLNDKVVLYKVRDSKLGEYDKSKDELVKNTLSQLINQELMVNLVKRLENTFEIQSLIQEKE